MRRASRERYRIYAEDEFFDVGELAAPIERTSSRDQPSPAARVAGVAVLVGIAGAVATATVVNLLAHGSTRREVAGLRVTRARVDATRATALRRVRLQRTQLARARGAARRGRARSVSLSTLTTLRLDTGRHYVASRASRSGAATEVGNQKDPVHSVEGRQGYVTTTTTTAVASTGSVTPRRLPAEFGFER
jgi:hypothetical protein